MDEPSLVQFLINPISGRQAQRATLSRLIGRLKAEGFQVHTTFTTGQGDAARVAEGLFPSHCRALVIVGGDGTVREAATTGANGVPVAIFPTGTENLLAKYLAVAPANSRCGADLLFELIRRGRKIDLDIVAVRHGSDRVAPANSRCGEIIRFLMIAGMGFDAEVVRRVSAARRGHIDYADYFWPTWRTFWSFTHPRLRVATEDGPIFDGTGMVFVGSIPRYAMGLRILLRADPQDGKLDVCIMRCGGRVRLLGHAVRTLLRRHVGGRDVVYRRAARVRVEADRRVDLQLDGDWAGTLPAEFEIAPHRATFLVAPLPRA